MTKKLEAIAGSLDQKIGAIRKAAYAWLKNIKPAYEDCYSYVLAVYEDSVVVEVYEGGECLYYQIDYTTSETETEMTATFANPRRVAVTTTVQELSGGGDGMGTVTVVKESQGAPAPNGLRLEQLPWPGSPEILEHEVDGSFRLWSRPKLEAVKDSGGVRKVRGRVPLMIAGSTTKSKTNYSVECCQHLYRDLKTFLESKADTWESEQGPWPVGAMYLSHGDRLTMQSGFNNLGDIAAKFTGVYVEGEKSIEDLREGDIIGVTFESITTPRGQALVALLTESTFIKGISLAGFKQDGKVESDGIDYVSRMKVEQGFGADFCDRPNTPYKRPSQAAPKLESRDVLDGKGTGMLDLERLKKESPELYEQLKAAQDKAEAAEKKLRGSKIEGAVTAVMTQYQEKLDPGLTESMKQMFLESVAGSVKQAADAVAEARPALEPGSQEFRDAVVSKVEPAFESEKKRWAAMKAEALKAGLKSAGLPEGAVVEGDPNVDGGKKPKIEAAPMINTLPYDALCVEADNERVGLPRGRKSADGKLIGCRITDVIQSRLIGGPVYMEHPAYGGPAHVLDVKHPHLRDTILEMSRVYSNRRVDGEIVRGVPFWVGANDQGVTDDELYRGGRRQIFEAFNAAVRGEAKLEANEGLSSDLGTLHPDIRQGVLEVLFAQAIWPNIATLVPCKSASYEIYYREYRRRGEQTFGTLAQGGAFAAGAGAITYAGRAFVKVTTLTATDCVLTVTYTDENGTTGLTTTVNVPSGSTVGTYIAVYPQVGHRIKAITNASAAGWSAGAVSFVAETDLNAGSELAVSGRAKSTYATRTGTVEEIDIDAELSWRMAEDANMSLANHGPGRVDAAADFIRDATQDFINWIDLRGVTLLNNATDFLAQNTMEFDPATPDPGISAYQWREELLKKIMDTSAMLQHRSHLTPDWMLVNVGDKSKFAWFMEKIRTAGGGARIEAFARGAEWGVIDNMRTFVSENQNNSKLLQGSRETVFYPVYVPLQVRGPLYNGQKADQYILRQRSAQLTVRPESRGYLEIV